MRTAVSPMFGSLLMLGVLSSLSVHALAQDSRNVEHVGGIGGDFRAVHVEGNYAYCGGAAGLLVVDVSNVSAPRGAGRMSFPSEVTDVCASGGYAYVANGLDGLRVIDVSDPAYPRAVGYYRASGAATDVYVVGSYVYVAYTVAGLHILRFPAQTPTYYSVSGHLELQGYQGDVTAVPVVVEVRRGGDVVRTEQL